MPRALITGITGQDGSYLAELLLDKGYEVFGMVRRASTESFERIEHIRDRLNFVQGDLLDQLSLIEALVQSEPDEVYNLAAQSFVPTSWSQPVLTAEFTAVGVTRLLEAIRLVDPKLRFYQASSSEMFGKVREMPQTELTPFYPRSPYGVAKCYGHYITVNYRESYDMFCCSGILFNHESPTARPGVRHSQDHRRRRAHQARPDRSPVARQPRRQARLGLRRRLRRRHVADAPAGRARRLRGRHRRDPHRRAARGARVRPRRPRLARVRRGPTRRSSARPRSTCWSATRRRRRRPSAGRPASASRVSCN